MGTRKRQPDAPRGPRKTNVLRLHSKTPRFKCKFHPETKQEFRLVVFRASKSRLQGSLYPMVCCRGCWAQETMIGRLKRGPVAPAEASPLG